MFPALPTGNEHQVRGLAEVLHDLKRGGLLTLDAVGIHRVDQDGRVPFGQLTDEVERVVEAAPDDHDTRAVGYGLRQLGPGHAALRHYDRRRNPHIRSVGGGRCAGVAGRGAGYALASGLDGLCHGHHHSPVFERPGRIAALQLEVEVVAAHHIANDAGLHQRCAAFSQ